MGVKVSVDNWDAGETRLQGGKMQGSSGSTETEILFVCLYVRWEITIMRSGSDAGTSSLVSPGSMLCNVLAYANAHWYWHMPVGVGINHCQLVLA